MIQVHRYVTPKTTRFAQIGDVGEETKEIVFALHGYGQLATEFAQSLMLLAAPTRVIICPEALSRFYTNHRARVSGANWMTSEDREFEIMDYVTYLDGLAEEVLSEAPENVRIVILGFSQGCHTASRWLGNGTISPDRLILWGADPAHDLSLEEWEALANISEITLVAGSEDEYLPADRLIRAEESLRDHQCTFSTVRYEGKHEIVREVLKGLWA